ncbi:mitochondrial inner membrane protein Mitofilin [Blastocladiella britannica]|nr:mitochondrial inner membrane protein Mitofilin [Blastocladiella britannica]
MVAKTPANYPDNGVESRLARIEWHLQREDLDSAAREVNQLNGWSRRVARDWLEEARRHLEVRMAVEVMQAQVAMMGLGAV